MIFENGAYYSVAHVYYVEDFDTIIEYYSNSTAWEYFKSIMEIIPTFLILDVKYAIL